MNVFAVLSLVASIVGILGVIPVAGSIIGIVFAVLARNEMAKDPRQRGAEYARWGLILGIIGLVVWLVIALVLMMLAALFGGFMEYWMYDSWR